MHTLIFANGDINDGPMVRRALAEFIRGTIIAADGGARCAAHFHLIPHIIIGDMDSLTETELADWTARGVQIQRASPKKDETDLELALKLAAERDADPICVVGGVGDRLDQTISNVYLLGLTELIGRQVTLVAGKQEICILRPGTHTVNGQTGDTISLLPVGGSVHGIHTQDLEYPLKSETLDFGPARGISNVMEGETATIKHESGILLMIHTVGRA